MNRRTFLVCFAGFAAVWSAEVGSTEKHTEPLERVVKKARLAVVASASSVSSRREGAMWRVLEFRVQVLSTVYGDPTLAALGCTYEEGQPHRRGQAAVSPSIRGSGIEFDIKAGDRMVLLIERAPTHGNDCRVLRIEPLSSEERVRNLREKSRTVPRLKLMSATSQALEERDA